MPADGPDGEPSPVRLRHFSRSLPMLLLKARESVMRHFRQMLRSHDITEQQWRILRALMTVQDLEVSELARATFLLGPSLSRILRDLEARALIERRQDAQDLRRAKIAIRPKGMALIEEVTPYSEAIYGGIAEAFGADRMADLQRLLIELEHAMADVSLSAQLAEDRLPPEDE